IVAIHCYRIIDPHVLDGPADVVEVLLEFELGRVHADHDQSLVFIFLGPRAYVRKLAPPVDTGIGPEIDENNLPTQLWSRQWLRIEPQGRPPEGGELALIGQFSRSGHDSRHHAAIVDQGPDRTPECGGTENSSE